jgi:hypothetical protein
MPEMLGVPLWVLSTPPLAAFLTVLTYSTAPQLRRDAALRRILIISIGLTALEAMVLVLLFGFLVFTTGAGISF